jgi:hypothetical protein
VSTSDNLTSPWILFEAGALSKAVTRASVVPYLLDISSAEISGPLSMFQVVTADEEATRRLVFSINRAADRPLAEQYLEKSFRRAWPDLEKEMDHIRAPRLVLRGKFRPQWWREACRQKDRLEPQR